MMTMVGSIRRPGETQTSPPINNPTITDTAGATSAAAKIADARRLLDAGDIASAQTVVEEVLAENEHCADGHALIAGILDRRGEWASSLAHLRRAHVLAPSAGQIQLNLAMALLRQGNYAEGLALYEARLEKPT